MNDIEIGEVQNIDFSKIASIVENNQSYYQEFGLDSLCRFSESVWSDLVKYKNTVCMDDRLEYFQIWLSISPMKLSLVQGRYSLLYDWIMRSIGDLNKESGNNYTWTYNISILHLFHTHSDSFIRDTFFEVISEWAYCLFYYSFKYNIWHDICRVAMSDLIAFIKEGIFERADLLGLRIDALLSIAAWAYLNMEDEAKSLVSDFELYLLRDDISDEIKKNIELLLVGSLGKCSDVSAEERAKKALHKYDCILHQHQRLQFAVAAYVDVVTIEDNLVLFKTAFEEIHKVVDD
ncbi:MAG: hypothetical protein HGB26_06175, partial [Desulfobulbaceae bacterium]|nr:hypothetical protein [Desulfobulbaceae bacterium]